MRFLFLLILLIPLIGAFLHAPAQPRKPDDLPEVLTVVNDGPVVVGEPFRVQYVASHFTAGDEFRKLDFGKLTLVSGPDQHEATTYGKNGLVQVRNLIYTLMASRPGVYLLPAATVRIGGVAYRSKPVTIRAITAEEAVTHGLRQAPVTAEAEQLLLPGEDANAKIRKNLFIRVTVDRESCYVGQPVTATFKLYSRLQSRSDIVRNPGLYGFSIQDMVSLADREHTVETVNGKTFDVHTIRKVQLYPLAAGTFQIDRMEVRNQVEFYLAAGRSRNEQRDLAIASGDDDASMGPTETFGNSMHTDPVDIRVKAVPDSNKPAQFAGAVGRFSVKAGLSQLSIAANQQGVLEYRVSGAGNFSQLTAPVVKWPAGVEGFEPEVRDRLDKEAAPLQGERVFRYHFIVSGPGDFDIEAPAFAYFNADTNRFITLTPGRLKIHVTPAAAPSGRMNEDPGDHSANAFVWPATGSVRWLTGLAILIVLILLTVILLLRAKRRRARNTQASAEKVSANETTVTYASNTGTATRGVTSAATADVTSTDAARQPIDVAHLLTPATAALDEHPQRFCTELRRAVWIFMELRYGLKSYQWNRAALRQLLTEQRIDGECIREIDQVLDHTETGIYSSVEEEEDRQSWLERARRALMAIRPL